MNRHRFDVFAFCAGVFFIALATGFLLDGIDAWDLDAGSMAPLLLIILGLAGVLSTLGHASGHDAEVSGDAAKAIDTERAAADPTEQDQAP